MRLLAFFCIMALFSLCFAEVPEHNPDLDSQCPQGFQWSRGTVSCKQADCPAGAGRTYTYDCNCGEAWDKPFRTCYDPERPGFAVACVAAGSPCPGEKPTGPGSAGNGSAGGGSAESCDYDSDCPSGYKCNTATSRCEAGSGAVETCNDFMCLIDGGSCINGRCVVENKCQNVTCDNKCEGGKLKSSGSCEDSSGQCRYSDETNCPSGCASSGKRCRIAAGKANFVDIDRVTKPLKGVRVEAEWYDELGLLRERLPTRYSDDDGSVDFSQGELDAYDNGSLSVAVVFEDDAGRVQIVDASPFGASPTDAQLASAPVANYTVLIYVDSYSTDSDINLTLDRTMNEAKYARVYYHAIEAATFMEEDLGVVMKNPPERFYLDDLNTTGAFHNAGGVKGAADKGIVYSQHVSRFTNPESPANREWHEFGHHIMYETYGYHLCCEGTGGHNHRGVENPTSVDSYTEGFAEFMSMMMLDYYNYPNKNLYFVGRTPFNMEMNFRYDWYSGNWPVEEMALAQIYYDLLDGGANDEDGIQLSRAQIWEVLSSEHNFGGQSRRIESISDAYRAFNDTNLPGIHDQWGNNMPFFISKWDRIFVTHGIYADRNGDGSWEPGEEIGYTLKGGAARAESADEGKEFNRPEIEGSYIRLDVTDEESGLPIDYYPIDVSVHSQGVEEGEGVSYDFEYVTYPDENGEININMPPEQYDTSMRFSVGGDENYERKDMFELTSEKFYQEFDPDTHVLESHSVSLKPKPKPLQIFSGGKESEEAMKKICPCASMLVLALLAGSVIIKR